MSKLKMWDGRTTWEQAEARWDEGAKQAACRQPVKGLSRLPNMPGMAGDTARFLKWKAFKWMIAKDTDWRLLRKFLKRPLHYGWGLIRSLLHKKPYVRDGDFFLYGIGSVDEFAALVEIPQALLVVGFSYCHKPFECPSGRFTDACIHDADHPVCRQCFIGKCVHALPPNRTIPVFIPTIHYIGEKILDVISAHPNKKILFLITACEMTLEMFGDLGNMAGIKGIGVRLDGRICNTLKAFELSETGIKPGLTVVLEPTQRRILDLLRRWHHYAEGVSRQDAKTPSSRKED